MSRSIGFRCEPARFHYVILDGSREMPRMITAESLTIPSLPTLGQQFQWVRREVCEILDKYSPDVGFYRASEGNAKVKSCSRAQVEAILIEAAASHSSQMTLESRVKSQIKRDTGFDGQARYVQNVLDTFDLHGATNEGQRDAELVALCGLPEGSID